MTTEQLKKYLKTVIDVEKTKYIQEQTIKQLDEKIDYLGRSQYIPDAVGVAPPSYGAWIALIVIGSLILAGGIVLTAFSSDCFFSTLAAVIGVFGAMLGLIPFIGGIKGISRDKNEYYESLDAHYKRVEELAAKKENDKKRVKNELVIASNVKEQRNMLYRQYQKTSDTLQKLYDVGIIFPKYHNIVAVCSFYEYLMSGRCTQLEGHEGAYNIFENELRMNMIIYKLDDVIAHLDRIEQNQYMLYDSINKGNSLITQLVKNTDSICRKADYIASQSEIAAQNSAWAASEAQAIKWIEILK